MRLLSFEVRGFKNLTQPVKLDGLGPINVIHGPNNVGKSNLLQAMQVFFGMIGFGGREGLSIFDRTVVDSGLVGLGIEPSEIFNLEKPAPIAFTAKIEVEEEELGRAGIVGMDGFPWRTLNGVTAVHTEIGMELALDGGHVTRQLKRLSVEGQDFFWHEGEPIVIVSTHGTVTMSRPVQHQMDPVRVDFIRRYAFFLSRNFLVRSQLVERFALVGVDRPLKAELALDLYDAKESAELERAKRWERFLEAMASFKDMLGTGSFVVTYDRKASKANIFYQASFARIPLRLLGSGVQQCVSLIGQLLMTNATLVAIEEPELNMRYTLQERLRDVFEQKVVGAPGGPSQLFLTSHSPAFESGSHFYLMVPTSQGPKVEARKVEQARLAVGFPESVVPPGENAVRCYLSTEGVVRVPERIREALGLPNGGGVMFIEKEGHVEMMSDERFATLLDVTDDGEGDEQS